METCGVILAGGKSTRMGTNKALLKIDNRTVIEKVASELQLVCDKVIIVTNVPDDYRFLDFDLIGDRYINKGPLAGIESAMYHYVANQYIIAACDMPFINRHIYRYLINNLTSYDAVVPKYGNRVHPLSGIYRRNVLKNIQEHIENENLKIRSFFAHINIHIIDKFNNIDKTLLDYHFFNMNNPEEYQQAKRS